jgi:hypothetical protein|tara:strand:- start:551 stop:931 length:381 start_codon:yes stop_codon:yes gene_type:complete
MTNRPKRTTGKPKRRRRPQGPQKITIVREEENLIIHTPFNPEYVEALKKNIPIGMERRWNPDRKAWVVHAKHEKLVRGFIGAYYPEGTIVEENLSPSQEALAKTSDLATELIREARKHRNFGDIVL